MSHQAVRILVEDVVKSIDDSVLFVYGRQSDFDAKPKKQEKRVLLDLLKESLEFADDSANLSKTFNCIIAFYKLDDLQGAEQETAIVLDEMDLLSDKFITKLNLFSLGEEVISRVKLYTQTIELKNIRKEPFVKYNDCTSGFLVRFDMVTPDLFDYCSLYD
tara:strand:- start:295 stop:777 length:483 start_codon:yes stop_codon:yes gene_type:complete